MSKAFASTSISGVSASLTDLPSNDLFDPTIDAEIILAIGGEQLKLSLDEVREFKRLLSLGETKLLAEHDRRVKAKNLSFAF